MKTSPIFVLTLFACGNAAGQSWESSLGRIPRQTVSPDAAVQGIIRNTSGLGLGGVTIDLWNESASQSVHTTTTGDGVFRILGLSPGHYQLTGGLAGFEPLERTEIELKPGDVFGFEQMLKAVFREPAPTPEPIASAAYRALPETTSAAPVIETRPPEDLPPAGQVFTPMPDRWKYEWPRYRRYDGSGEYPYVKGRFLDPFNQNKLKGDEPILGQRTFLNLTFTSETQVDGRLLPTPSNVPSSNPGSQTFFGGFGQLAPRETLGFSFDLFHGDTSFRPIDWQIKFTPEVNVNYLAVQETGIVNVDPRAGTTRLDSHAGLQEAFAEVRLKDLSHAYDFVSLRAGIQGFNSDFRGFIFNDQEPGARIFGNFDSNRYQYNAAYFAMPEKDTNSGLNTFSYRHQQVLIANLYRQDFIKPGYTIQASFHYDKDDPSFQFDANNFLVRPRPSAW